MRPLIWTALLASIASPALAHDFWLQPMRFALQAPGTVPVLILVGHGRFRERWGLSRNRVVLFRTVGPDGMINRMDRLTLNGPRVDAMIPLAQPGSYVLAFQSTEAISSLPALRFDQYVAEEGIAPIQVDRARRKATNVAGREVYSRRAKAIVQVGPIDQASVTRVTRPLGLSLEIVPERHPGTLRPGVRLPLRVLYKGRPLPGALVKLTNLSADEKPLAMQRTNRAGRTGFAIPKGGPWQFNVIWSEVLAGDPGADYRTTFSSLTIGSSQFQ